MDPTKFRPFISHSKEYRDTVAKSIAQKAPLEDIPFHLLTDVLSSVGIQGNPYDYLKDDDSFFPESIHASVHESYTRVVEKSTLPGVREKLSKLWDYLCEGDTLKKADLIFTFGSGYEDVPRAVAELYREGWAPRVMFAGRTAAYLEKSGFSEAEHFAQIARDGGVPSEAIILEKESVNTPENVVNSKRILEENDSLPRTVILATYARHMRRAYLTFKAVFGAGVELIRYPVESQDVGRDNFFMSEKIWTYVVFEYLKLFGARQMKHY